MLHAQRTIAHFHQLTLCKTHRPESLLFGGWLLVMITIPILRWTIGDGILPWSVTLSVCLLAATVVTILLRQWQRDTTARVVLTVIALAWTLEFVGHTTGFPFGAYDYTETLQPQLGGVPLLIPLAWLMMLPSAWAVGQIIARQTNGLRFVLISAAAFTAWDFFLDPQMVHWGFWAWERQGGYFGIPWINFVGWFAGSALITAVAQPPKVPVIPLFLIYIITWFLQSVGQALFWQMVGPALVGFIAMGLFVYWSSRIIMR